MNERNKDIERLIADGLIGESFGAFLAKDDDKEEAIPFIIMEDGNLYEIRGEEGKRLIKKSCTIKQRGMNW